MDRFKFRAWPNPRDGITLIGRGMIETKDIQDFDLEDRRIYFDHANIADFDDLVLMQCTGLKDKNGKLIFEGDVLQHPTYRNYNLTGEHKNAVKWGETGDSDGYYHDKHFEWVVGHDSLADVYENSEIIGNIYENPELIKE